MLGKINEKLVKYSDGGMQTNITSYIYHCNDSFAQNIKISRNVMAILPKKI